MKLWESILYAVALSGVTSCSTLEENLGGGGDEVKYKAFVARSDYPATLETYQNDKLLAQAAKETSVIRVDLSEQRARLVVDERVAIDAPCCTGKAGKRTPRGEFPIKEKIVNKRSTIFGSLYRKGRKVYGGDRRKYGGSYDRYVGAALPYWMRLTDDGIGMHASEYVHRYPKSNGCIRVPRAAITAIFAAVETGTPVHVIP